jgi:N-methylhydantoinase B
VIDSFNGEIAEGDVILLNDPYLCKGSISHLNDWLVIVPIFHEGTLVGYSSMFGHMMDVGGRVPGSQVSDAISIWDEGLRIPPIKVFEKGVLNETALRIILNNTRTPDMNHSDLLAIVAACRAAEARVMDLCNRFGRATYMQACDELLERTKQGMIKLVRRYIPEEKVTFWDWVDDDGLGHGPFKLQLTIWREGDKAFFDWTGTDPQAPGSINFHIHESLCKMFFGVYLIMVFDPAILFNEGYNDVFEVILPEGSLLNPKFPAPLSNRLNIHTRFFDCQSGALGQKAPELAMAAGYGTSPYFVYHGEDENGDYFQMVELLFGGLPGREIGDGLDGHSWWPMFRTTPAEYIESYYPLVLERYEPVMDTGGAGLHRGGCGIEKQYLFRAHGSVTVNDDRAIIDPWGIGGGASGGRSAKTIVRADGTREELPSKIDNVPVAPGDRMLFRTAGAGGWGDPLERPADQVDRDVRRRLVSAAAAHAEYGVVIGDADATDRARTEMRAARGAPGRFDFGELPGGLVAPA